MLQHWGISEDQRRNSRPSVPKDDVLAKLLLLASEQQAAFEVFLANMKHGARLVCENDRILLENEKFSEMLKFVCPDLHSFDPQSQILFEQIKPFAKSQTSLSAGKSNCESAQELFEFKAGVFLKIEVISLLNRWQLLLIDDVSKETAMVMELQSHANTDALTGLQNRRSFGNYYLEAANTSERLILILIDLDAFKLINDKLGHDVGDRVLINTTKILSSVFANAELICRLGGDEFAIAIKETGGFNTQIQQIALGMERVGRQLSLLKDDCGGEDIGPTALPSGFGCSAGIARIKCDEMLFIDALKAADLALYEAKRRGKMQSVFHNYNGNEVR